MALGLIVRFSPVGPWRFGPDSGARDRAEPLGHSDTVYSAVCGALLRLGLLEEWLDATARSESGPAVAFSSFFPFVDEHLLLPAPKHLWPPPPSAKVRWKTARFVPLEVTEALLAGEPVSEDRWVADSESECLVPLDLGYARAPFRRAVRSSAAVDRLTGASEAHRTACLEFSHGSGMWLAVAFADVEAQARWEGPVRAAFNLLADNGIGGERSRGWGRAGTPEISTGDIEDLLRTRGSGGGEELETAYWLLSLFHPAPGDSVDWQRGNYSLLARGGRIESPVRHGEEKRILRMVEEGSVLYANQSPSGMARDVAPEGFPHPVFRAGFAVALRIRIRVAS